MTEKDTQQPVGGPVKQSWAGFQTSAGPLLGRKLQHPRFRLPVICCFWAGSQGLLCPTVCCGPSASRQLLSKWEGLNFLAEIFVTSYCSWLRPILGSGSQESLGAWMLQRLCSSRLSICGGWEPAESWDPHTLSPAVPFCLWQVLLFSSSLSSHTGCTAGCALEWQAYRRTVIWIFFLN